MTRIFQNRINPGLFAQKSYPHVDRILVLDESDGKSRQVVGDYKFSEFDLTDWKELSHIEYESAILNRTESFG